MPSRTRRPRRPLPPARSMRVGLSPAMLEWAIEQPPEACQRLLSLPEVPGHASRALIPRPSPALQQAFEATLFEVGGSAPAVFRIGDEGAPVDRWLAVVGAGSACIVTAWNPFSSAAPAAQNARRQLALVAQVEAAGLRWLPAQGRDPSGDWPPEDSLCVLDASEAQVTAWLRAFEQFAVVLVSAGAACRLRWHPEVRV